MEQSIIPTLGVPASSDSMRIQERFAILLALIAGYIDATGLIKWKTYVSFMSGNTTQLGAALAKGNSGIIFTSLTAIASFVLGVYAGTCLSLWKRNQRKSLPFFIVSGLLAFYTIFTFHTINVGQSIGIIAFSMGIMNTIVTSVGNQKVNTDFVTGTLNSLARNIAIWSMTTSEIERKISKSSSILLLLLWAGFLSGAAGATFLFPFLAKWTLLLPASLLLFSSVIIPTQLLNTKSLVKQNNYVTKTSG